MATISKENLDLQDNEDEHRNSNANFYYIEPIYHNVYISLEDMEGKETKGKLPSPKQF